MKDEAYSDPDRAAPGIRGWGTSLEAGRYMVVSPSVKGKMSGGLSYDEVTRQGYTDAGSTFPFTYNSVRYRLSYAFVSAGTDVSVTPKLTWVTQVRGEQDLTAGGMEFDASSQYLGEVNRQAKITHTRWNVDSGMAYAVTPSVNVSVIPWTGNSALGDITYGGNLSVTGHF